MSSASPRNPSRCSGRKGPRAPAVTSLISSSAAATGRPGRGCRPPGPFVPCSTAVRSDPRSVRFDRLGVRSVHECSGAVRIEPSLARGLPAGPVRSTAGGSAGDRGGLLPCDFLAAGARRAARALGLDSSVVQAYAMHMLFTGVLDADLDQPLCLDSELAPAGRRAATEPL